MILNDIQLPAGLIWSDEHSSASVAQTVRRALNGSPVVYYAGLTAGRPITLESGEDTGWLTYEQVQAIAPLAASPGAVFPLTIRGQTFQVMFRHQDAPAFDARPIFPFAAPKPGDYYIAAIKLMTI